MNQPYQQKSGGGYHGGGGQKPAGGGSGAENAKLSVEILNSINFGDGKSFAPELFWQVAEKVAKEIGDNPVNKHKMDKQTQVRKFYDEVILLRDRIGSSEEKFKESLPFIKMIYAKVAYSKGRDVISAKFDSFMYKSLSQINNLAQFRIFATFFEAFMGFYRNTEQGKQK